MNIVISLWSKPGKDRKCEIQEVELTQEDLCEAAIKKAGVEKNDLHHWQVERIEL